MEGGNNLGKLAGENLMPPPPCHCKIERPPIRSLNNLETAPSNSLFACVALCHSLIHHFYWSLCMFHVLYVMLLTLRGILLISKGQAGVAEFLGNRRVEIERPPIWTLQNWDDPHQTTPLPPGVASFLHHLLMLLIHDNTIVITEWYFVILYCHNSMTCYKRNVDDCA